MSNEIVDENFFYSTPLRLGKLHLKNRVFLAPLAGVSDIPFRRICSMLGAGLTYVEMLSATAVLYGNERTFRMMGRHPQESVLGAQITGASADQVAEAIKILSAREMFDTIDINMGCPVRKVVNAGCGSAILQDPERITETVTKAREATLLPLSAKFRLGYTRNNVNVQNTVERVIAAGVDMYTIHGRTRSEDYSVPCDLKGIRAGMDISSSALQVVKVGNGDIFDLNSALEMRRQTGCDAVMVSRGALGNPWIFREIISGGQAKHPCFDEWLEVVLQHLDWHEEYFGNTRMAAVVMRKHLLWYCKGFPGGKAMREKFNTVESLDDARALLRSYAATVPPNFIRHEGFSSLALQGYDPKYEMDRNLDRGVGDEGMLV